MRRGERIMGDAVPDEPATPEAFLAGHPVALATWDAVRSAVDACGPYAVRVTRSQVALRRRRGFAYLWLPGRWLRRPGADVVLSIALDREIPSPRFKQVAHPAPATWMHHLEVRDAVEVDGEVVGWLRDAYARAG